MASFILLQLPSEDTSQVNADLRGLIRHSDLVGKSSDGYCYLLLTQINRSIFKTIGERLAGRGIAYTIVEGM